MYNFDHPNVLKLLGVCMDGGPAPFIVMPFMANGSLNEYLKKERENLLLDPESTTPENVVRVNMYLGQQYCPLTTSCRFHEKQYFRSSAR